MDKRYFIGIDFSDEPRNTYKDHMSKKIKNREPCDFPKCKEKSVGIARCKNVCNNHFYELKADNIRRMERGISIPNSFKTLRLPKKKKVTELRALNKMKGG